MRDQDDSQPRAGEQKDSELSQEQFAEMKDAFQKTVNMGLAERDEYLINRYKEQPHIREMVIRLLEASEKPLPYETLADDLLVAHIRAQDAAAPHISSQQGSRIAGYRLLERLGEGGFGVVYLAEQETPVRRQVALKVIKLGMDTAQVIARFEAERQALALMEHPGIAQVYDAGSTETGRPYFVMELVRGESITSYCDRNKLSITDRLKLFRKVCDALHHAHQKGVIHRDIKPSNILVMESDGKPIPKIIDFGIAKATNNRLSEKTIFTEFRQMIGTPEYMSPEQAMHSASELDSRTDVYSLGVLLYELLTGTTPFDSERLRSAAYAEMQRIIHDEDPQRPSTRLSNSGTRDAIANSRSIAPDKLDSTLTGELDWIVMRCLNKAPSLRYDSASELGREIHRYLTGSPVEAVPPSRRYLLHKWFNKHRRSAIFAASVIVLMVIGLAGTSFGFLNAQDQKRIAETEKKRAQWQTYVAQMQLSWSALGDKPGRASDFLEKAPEELRGWEWHALQSRLDLSYKRVPLPWPEGYFPESTGMQCVSYPHPNGQSLFHVYLIGDILVEQREIDTGKILMSVPVRADVVARPSPNGIQVSSDGSSLYIVNKLQNQRNLSNTNTVSQQMSLQIWDVLGGALKQEVPFSTPLDAVNIVYQASSDRILYSVGTTLYSMGIDPSNPDRSRIRLPYNVEIATLDPNNEQLFVKGPRGEASILRTCDLTVSANLVGHTNLIRGHHFSRNGEKIVTASLDGTARIWDIRSDPVQHTVIDAGIPLNHAWLSQDGSLVVTESGLIRVWDATNGKLYSTLASESVVRWSSFILPNSNIAGARNADGSIGLWYLDAKSTIQLEGHTGHVNSSRFSGPTGYIISGGWDGWSSNESGCVRIWDAETGLLLASVGEPGEVAMSVEVTGDGRFAVCRITRGDNTGTRIIDLVSGNIRHIPGFADGIVVHPSEYLFITASSGKMNLYNLVTGEVLRSWAFPYKLERDMQWISNGTGLGIVTYPAIIGNQPNIHIVDLESFSPDLRIPGTYATASTDHSELFVYSQGEMRFDIYNTSSLEIIRSGTLDGLGSGKLSFDINDERIASSSPDDQAIMLWDLETLNRVAVFTGDGYVSDLAWNLDGTRLLATWDESIHIFDTSAIGDRAKMRAELRNALQKSKHLLRNSNSTLTQDQTQLRASYIQKLLDGLHKPVVMLD